ncbi:single-strand DNA-binding protein [Lewinella aquimaris]|uniref:Single-stranded DNA-binding protein n=1 Tax=Neolewinella aquimaris TaxID=1835722 RepID=A0A840EF08_9BACT|nr:single-stranded DNA-binding protein [Neolewinella aquimaris]MBB4079526.1 single-strand DNA-binding protein [Neolewinella aquimaris]
MINRITLAGYLGADPEIRTLSNGTMVAKLRLATTDNYRDRAGQWQEDTQWHDVVLWRHLAEKAQKYAKKGSLVYLEGKLAHRKWEDKEGNPRKTTEVVGAMLRLLDGKRDEGDDSADGATTPTTTTTAAPAAKPVMEAEEDLPF